MKYILVLVVKLFFAQNQGIEGQYGPKIVSTFGKKDSFPTLNLSTGSKRLKSNK